MAVISGDTLRMPSRSNEDNQKSDYARSYDAMLTILNRYYELTGDAEVKRVVDDAKAARRR